MSPNCLMARVLKSKYFKDCSFMEAGLGNNPSWVWRSIWEGRKVLEAGFRWSIGNGASVRIDKDPWLPLAGDFKPRRIDADEGFTWVRQLINDDMATWKEEVISRLFFPDHARCILSIPLSWTNKPDAMVWHFTHSGHYSVSSGYMAALDLQHRRQGSSDDGSTDENGSDKR